MTPVRSRRKKGRMKREELMKIDENGWRERGRVNVTQACRTVVMQDV